MVTAIVNQHIRKRFRKLPGLKQAEPTSPLAPPRSLLPEKLQPDAGKAETVVRPRLLPGNAGLILLALLCCLLLLAYRFSTSPLLHTGWRSGAPELPADPAFEELLYNQLISEDVKSQPMQTAAEAATRLASLDVVYYTIKKGDNLSAIAAGYRLKLDTLISFNHLSNARTLQAGSKLAIPNTDGIKYKVKRGDSLSGIATRYNIPLNNLLDWNDITSAVIYPGTEYFIPGASLSRNELNRALGILFIYPVKGRLTSPFGWRKDPFSGARSFHNGIDLANTINTPLKAAMDGQVVKTSFTAIFGKYMIIKHNDGFQTLYGHLSSYAVREKQQVKQGQKIGYMGNTGYSTGTHLHFAIFENGEPVDPLKFLNCN